MNVNRLAMPFFNLWMFTIIFVATLMVTMRLAGDVVHSIRLKFGLLHQAQKPVPLPLIEVYPVGDIPQPETANMGNKLSAHR